MTENLAVPHLTVPGRNQEGSTGLPYDGVDARIDPATNEIRMHNGAPMIGYYKAPELTREAFCADGWLHTGDTGRIDAQGLLRITGRLKDLFKTSKGKYVAPAPIEDKLVMHDAVEACVVAGANLRQPPGIAMLGAETVARLGDPGAAAELEASLGKHLQSVNETLDRLDGSGLRVRPELDAAWYGKPATPDDILARRDVSNPDSTKLAAEIEAYSH